MLLRRLKFAGTFGVILRRVWDDVEKNHVEKFKQEFPQFARLYSNRTVHLPNGSKIMFMASENEDDTERKFWGPEYMDIFADQAEQFAEKEIRDMKMACRWPGMPDHACKLGLFYNPGGVSMPFLKRIFFDKKYEDKERPEDFAFIHAYGWDNVEWVKPALNEDGLSVEQFYSWDAAKRFRYFITRSQYGRDLDAQPAHIRIGHLLGRFDRFAGQYFGAVYDRDKMRLSNEQILRLIKPWWVRWLSLDWGFHHNVCVYWWARGTVTADELRKITGLVSKKTPVDVIVTYKTILTSQVGEEEIAMEIVRNCDDHERKTISRFFVGPIGAERKAKKGTQHSVEQQIGQVMREHGMPAPMLADDARVSGWRLMYNQMRETAMCAKVGVN